MSLAATPASAAAPSEPLNVVSSFSIITDLAHNVGGDRVSITTLVGPDGDAHVYEPKPADAIAISKADVVLVNGLQLEGFLPRLIKASQTKAPVVALTHGIRILPSAEHHHDHDHDAGDDHDHDHDHRHGPNDPHAWQSVGNAQIYVKNITTAFCAADADGCPIYQKNAANYTQQLQVLDREIRTTVDALPRDKRTIITSHDAFGYFQHDYGLAFLAPEGVSTASEASAADVAALIKQVRQEHASAVFVENITNPNLVERIAQEAGVQVGGTLYSDALSGADGPAATYLAMMKYNVQTIANAITGSSRP